MFDVFDRHAGTAMRSRVLENLVTLSRLEQYGLATLFALCTGWAQLTLFFPDNPPGVTFLLVAAASAIGGSLLGVVVPRGWPVFGMVACWGSALAGLLVLRGTGGLSGLYLLATAYAAVLAGGVLGGRVHSKLAASRLNRSARSDPYA